MRMRRNSNPLTESDPAMRHRRLLTATCAMIAFAGVADAHPRLVAANPAPNASVVHPARVMLRFSEKLIAPFAKADLMMAAAPNAAMAKLASNATLAADGRTLVVTPRAPLVRGRYTIAWHVVSTDTHKVAGSYAFTVR